MRENIAYVIGPRGLDLKDKWKLDVPVAEKRELSVPVPSSVHLTAIKADGRNLTWRIVRDPSSSTDTALIELPKTTAKKALQIALDAWQPLVLNLPWRLPRLRPEGVFWSAGHYELSIAADYELVRLEPTECIETGVNAISSGADSPERHSLTAYAPSAAVEISLSQRQPEATIRADSSLSLADPDLKGRLVTQWKLSHGATHQLVGAVAAGWVIETVETIPTDAMTDWIIDRHGNQRRIEIHLSRAVNSTRQVSVVVTGRLQRFGLSEPISAKTMRMVAWEGAKTAQHLLTFQSNAPYAVAPVGNLPEIALDGIDDRDRALLDLTADNKIFDVTNPGKNAGLQLTFRRGQYSANIDTQIALENGVLREDYHLTTTPVSDPIDRLVVYATSPLGDSVRWTDAASNAPLKAEKVVPGDAQRTGLPKEGEAWLLRFPQPTSRPIEIVTTVDTKPTESQRALVPLISLPEAAEQHGRILVRCRKPGSLWLEPVRMETIPLPLEAPTQTHLIVHHLSAAPIVTSHPNVAIPCGRPSSGPS